MSKISIDEDYAASMKNQNKNTDGMSERREEVGYRISKGIRPVSCCNIPSWGDWTLGAHAAGWLVQLVAGWFYAGCEGWGDIRDVKGEEWGKFKIPAVFPLVWRQRFPWGNSIKRNRFRLESTWLGDPPLFQKPKNIVYDGTPSYALALTFPLDPVPFSSLPSTVFLPCYRWSSVTLAGWHSHPLWSYVPSSSLISKVFSHAMLSFFHSASCSVIITRPEKQTTFALCYCCWPL